MGQGFPYREVSSRPLTVDYHNADLAAGDCLYLLHHWSNLPGRTHNQSYAVATAS